MRSSRRRVLLALIVGLCCLTAPDLRALTTLLSDTFTDTTGTRLNAHTMDVGAGWTENSGTWTITANTAHETTTKNAIASAEASNANVTMSLSTVLPNVASYVTGGVVRVTDGNNAWLVISERDSLGTPYIAIVERNAGTNTTRASVNLGGSPLGSTVTLTTVTNGNTITLTANTGENCSYASASFNNTATKHGLFSYTDAAGGYVGSTIDNFLVTVASSTTTCGRRLLLNVGC